MQALIAFIRFLLAVVAVTWGLGSAVGGIGSLGGAFDLRLDILAHFAPVWAVLGLTAFVCGLIGGSRIGAYLGLAGLAASAFLIAPEALAASRIDRTPIAEPTLKIVDFNIWGRNRQQAATAEWILRQDADIVVLQEAYGGTEEIIRILRRRYPHVTPCVRNPCSAMILSRVRPIATGGMEQGRGRPTPPPCAGRRCLQTPERALEYMPGRPRVSGVWARFQGERGPYTVVGVHFTWPIPAGPQRAQMEQLAEMLRGFDRDRLIVAGDFNTAPWSDEMRVQDRAFGIPRHSRALPSWPAAEMTRWRIRTPFAVMPIDHVYAGEGWRRVRVVRGPRLGSDHYPLVITLSDRQP